MTGTRAPGGETIIGSRYNGPPGSGNGGWTAGTFAALLDGGTTVPSAQVTLRTPPPLETPLSVRTAGEGISVHAPDGTLVAEAIPVPVALEPIPPVSFAEAEAISLGFPGFTAHPFPTCFVCGPERAPGDGLRMFPGRTAGGETATPFTVPDDVSAATVWAALDCPGGWSVEVEARPYVLGRVSTHVAAVPEPGSRCVVMGRRLVTEGRKASVAVTLYDPAGTALAWSRATWIAIAGT